MVDESECIFIDRLKAGESSAFDDLIHDQRPALLRLATVITGDREAAEDVVQETFLNLYRSIQSFNGHGRLSTYLYRITVNGSIGHLRARRRRSQLTQRLPQIQDVDDVGTEVEKRETVAAALARLPLKFRAPLLLLEVMELPYREIAQVLKIPVNTVRSRIFRAREKLLNILKNLGNA